MSEFLDVIKRPRFRPLFSTQDVNHLLIGLSRYSVYVQTHSKVCICRDPKDDFLLELCQDGKATHLITGDADLLVMRHFKETKIMRLADLLSHLHKKMDS